MGLTAVFFKSGANVLAKLLAFIFQLSLQSGIVPDEWKLAKVTPIHKGGVIHDPNQYRPISVISTVMTIFERIVHNQFSHILTVNNCLAQEQSGFRPRHSTQRALLDVSDFLLKQMDNGKFVGAVFLDLRKAFDTVNHTVLLNKLHIISVRGLELDWFRSYLCGKTQVTKIGNVLSNKFDAINFGVPFGPIIIFNMY